MGKVGDCINNESCMVSDKDLKVMSGYPHHNSAYSYGPPPPQPYSSAAYGGPPPPGQQPPSQTPYAAQPPFGQSPYGAQSPYGGQPPYAAPYSSGAPSAPYAPPGAKPHKENNPSSGSSYGGPPPPTQQHSSYGGSPPPTQQHSSYGGPRPSTQQHSASGYPPSAPFGSPFASLVPSAFPPGTDPNVIACFQLADQDRSGLIDDVELQSALSSYNESFGIRTVHLLMYLFTNTNTRKIGPKEFTSVFYSLQNWRANFEKFDRDRSGRIDTSELRDALLSLGFSVSPTVLDLLISKFDKSGGRNRAIEYDNFIECCLTVKGLTEKFKEKDLGYTGSATFTYESFMLTVLPFLIA